MPNANICMLPWVSVETSPVGSARPCCLALGHITKPDGTEYNLNTDTLEEIYNSDYMRDMRQEFIDGKKPEACQRCWDEEAAGRQSKRINSIKKMKPLIPLIDFNSAEPSGMMYVDLKLGNICNIKCRTCGSWSSSKWATEDLQNVPYEQRKTHIAKVFMQQGEWPRKSPVFWDNMRKQLPSIRYFDFTGGEPFMIQEHFDLLQYSAEQGYSKHQQIHYNTNGTQWPEDAEQLWKQFELVEIAFSIDNVGDRFELERSGAKWDEVNANIQRFREMRERNSNITLQVCLTINTQNVYYLEELCAWIAEQNFNYDYFNMLHDPRHFNIGEMTAEAKELVINKLRNGQFIPRHQLEIDRIIKFIENGPTSDGAKFVREMKRLDQRRNENFAVTHPEIAQAMGYE
jgi:MoaA/NifB/PqqE/SkfB family radical SAM enzyme